MATQLSTRLPPSSGWVSVSPPAKLSTRTASNPPPGQCRPVAGGASWHAYVPPPQGQCRSLPGGASWHARVFPLHPSWRTPQGGGAARKSGFGGFSDVTKQRRGHVAASASPTQADAPPPSSVLESAYGALSTALTVNILVAKIAVPNLFSEVFFNTAITQTQALFLRTCGVCLIPLAVALSCLKDAASHNRLSSATYQRLNLGANFFAVLFLRSLLLSRGAGFHTPLSLAVFGVAGGVLLIVSGVAFGGAEGEFLLWNIVKGFVASVVDLFRPKTVVAGAYSLFSLGLFMQGVEAFVPAGRLGGALFEFFLEWCVAGGLWFAAIVAYVQKDAADRGRLGASTFKALNAALASLAAALLLIAAYATMTGIVVFVDRSALPAVYLRLGFLALMAVTCMHSYLTAKK